MQVDVTVLLRHKVKLPKTAVCRVEVRDVTYLDAPSKTLSVKKAPVAGIVDETVLKTRLKVPSAGPGARNLNVWAHLSMTGVERIQVGDYVTTVAYPIAPGVGTDRVIVELQRVGPLA